ncbi:MAG: GTP cyclohydrolase I FolE [Elusimicrobiales bacterium]
MTTKIRTADEDAIVPAVKDILLALGEDPRREGLLKTPQRAAKALREITCGYRADIDALFNNAFFKVQSDDLVAVTGIHFYSMCEHHMLPFFGKVHIGYIPDGKIVGLSKMPRLVHALAARLQVQERLTRQIADILDKKLSPRGVAVIVEARHLCMEMRGAKSSETNCVTSAMLGELKKDAAARDEFLRLIRKTGDV